MVGVLTARDAPHTERAFRGGARARRGYDTGRGRAGDSRRLRRRASASRRALGRSAFSATPRGDAPPRGERTPRMGTTTARRSAAPPPRRRRRRVLPRRRWTPRRRWRRRRRYGDAAPDVGGPAEASAAAATACGALLCDTDLVDATISRLVCEPSMALRRARPPAPSSWRAARAVPWRRRRAPSPRWRASAAPTSSPPTWRVARWSLC